jgi:hypothetical protein
MNTLKHLALFTRPPSFHSYIVTLVVFSVPQTPPPPIKPHESHIYAHTHAAKPKPTHHPLTAPAAYSRDPNDSVTQPPPPSDRAWCACRGSSAGARCGRRRGRRRCAAPRACRARRVRRCRCGRVRLRTTRVRSLFRRTGRCPCGARRLGLQWLRRWGARLVRLSTGPLGG